MGGSQRRLAEEYERCAHYLDGVTRKPLVAAVEAQLLERHMGAILEKGFDALMAEQRVPDLARFPSWPTFVMPLLRTFSGPVS